MSHSANLLSAARLAALSRRRRTRGWTALLSGYTLAVGVAWLGFAAAMRTTSSAEALADVQVRLDARETERINLAKEIAKREARLALTDAVVDHPDWSLLLRLIASANGQEVGLHRVTVVATPAADAAKGGDLPVHGPWTVSLAGMAPSQRAASEFVARLEALRVFASVTLTETREREGLAGGPALVDFAVLCTLREQQRPASGGRP